MKMRVALWVSLILAIASLASGQRSGCVYSQDNSGGCGDSTCATFCTGIMEGAVPLTETLSPGLIWRQTGQRVVVAGMLPRSPAVLAGLRMGDELVGIDGFTLPLFVEGSSVWQARRPHAVVIRRDGRLQSVELTPLPLAEVLAAAILEANPFQQVSLRSSLAPVAPFISGLVLRRDGQRQVVKAVLPRSVADIVGLRPGDTIERRSLAGSADAGSCQSVESADFRCTVEMVVHRGGEASNIHLSMDSLSEYFERLALPSGERKTLFAKALD